MAQVLMEKQTKQFKVSLAALEQMIAEQMEIGAEFSDAFIHMQSGDLFRVHEFDDCSNELVLIGAGTLRLVPPICSQDLYLWMQDFAAVTPHFSLRPSLQNALSQIGAVWKFRNILYHHPQVSEEWDDFKRQKLLAIAREWIASMGI